jgi:hypothetical protein
VAAATTATTTWLVQDAKEIWPDFKWVDLKISGKVDNLKYKPFNRNFALFFSLEYYAY